MTTFRDADGREWLVAIHTTAIKRVRASLGVDLYSLVDNGFAGLGKLLGDVVALCDVLFVLCQDEARQRGIDDEAFGRSMHGDALERAAASFLEEYSDFFPDPRIRAGLKRIIEASRKVRERSLDRMTEELARLDLENLPFEAATSNGSSGSSPGSSVSIPAPSPSASLT